MTARRLAPIPLIVFLTLGVIGVAAIFLFMRGAEPNDVEPSNAPERAAQPTSPADAAAGTVLAPAGTSGAPVQANAEQSATEGWDLRLFDLGGGETIYIAYIDQNGASPALGVGCVDGDAPMMLVRPSGEDDAYEVEAAVSFRLDDGRGYTADASFFPPEFFLRPSDDLLSALRGSWVEVAIGDRVEGRLSLVGAQQAIGDAMAGCN